MKHLTLLSCLLLANQFLAQTFNKTVYNTGNSGLPHNYVRSIAIDNNDVVWVGTQEGGLARFDGINWSVWNTSNTNMPGNNVRLVQPLENGEVWFSVIDYTTGFGPYRLAKLAGNDLAIWEDVISGWDDADAFDFYDNKVWISTSSGLYVYENDEFVPFNTANNCIPPTAVSDILFISPEKYWIALSDYTVGGLNADGLMLVDQNNCFHYNDSNSGFPSDNVTLDLKRDKDNPDKVWMRTNGGVVGFDGVNWEILSAPGTSLPECYAIDTVGDIWAAYNFHGLQRYNGTWHSHQNLVNDEVDALAVDSHNNLWVGTASSGLIKLERVLTSTSGNLPEPSVKCYPTILGQELYLEQAENRTLSLLLTDVNNRVVLQQTFSGQKASIPLPGYEMPAGVYFYCIRNARKDVIQTGKLLKTTE